MQDKIISADSHLDLFYLPPDIFTARAPASLKDRVPKVVESGVGPMWVCDGAILGRHGAWHGTGRVDESDYRGQRMSAMGWHPAECRPSNPKLRLEDQDIDGVEAEVINGIRLVEDIVKDPELVTATYRAFNDFMAEFCEYNPKRLIGIGDIPAHSPEAAAAEIRRIGKGGLGLKGALFDWFNCPMPIWHSMWEPMWAAAEEAEVALSFHVAGSHGTTTVGSSKVEDRMSREKENVSHAAGQAVTPIQADECLASIILCGALERYPGLKVVMAESSIGWIPYLIDRLDYKYEEGTYKGLIKTLPSEQFRRQVWATFMNDKVGVSLAEEYGPDNFCWASDYPHRDGLWPDSQKFIRQTMGHLSREMHRKLTHDNVARLYNLE